MPARVETAWPVLEVEPGLSLHITRGMPPLDSTLDAVVERHWQQAGHGRVLFNGQVFSADVVAPGRIEGHWAEYRRVVAQMRDPGLRRVLGVRNLAVCGVLRCPDGVAVARRESGAVYQAGEWQLPPAGSVDSASAVGTGASWRRALLLELREELGLVEDDVRGMRPLCLVQHPSGVLDLGVEIITALRGAAIVEAYRACGSAEYDRIMILPPADIPAAVAALGEILVPSAAAYLARLDLD